MIAIINFLNTVFWGYVLIYGLLAFIVSAPLGVLGA